MPSSNRQVFQTATPSRWKKFKWGTRILSAIGLLFVVVLVLALIRGTNPSLPNLEAKARIFESKLDPSDLFTIASSQNKKYKGFKDFLEKRDKTRKHAGPVTNFKAGNHIRGAFYTPWDNRGAGLTSLEKNCDKLNMVFPEWFFIDSNDHTKLQTRIDSASLVIMQHNRVGIIPILTNYNSKKQDFDGELLKDILGNAQKQKAFIQQITHILEYYKLQGINIDFEELADDSREKLVAFQKNLYETLHAKGLMVTMDVAPKNDDYDYKTLSTYNDYIVLMAYDQHFDKSAPGPVSDQKWIEEVLDWTAQRIEPGKIILGLAGYGYDWSKDDNGKWYGESITYDEAINKAKIANAVIDFDNNNYNLHYRYSEEDKDDDSTITTIEHEVWFTDAGTTFNILRFSDDYATAGAVLWRLGSEDERMWKYYGRDLSDNAIAKEPFDYSALDTIPVNANNVSYSGEGEILNILYKPQEGKIKVEVDSTEQLIAEQEYQQLPSGFVIEKFAEDTSAPGPGHKLVLTFDDGPDPRWTPGILDILEKQKVPAAFFVVGLQAEKNIPILQRVFKDGYEIGNHTFTHGNIAKMSPRRAGLEMKLTRLLIESVTGHSTVLFRAPYNADSEPHTFEELEPIARSREQNYVTIGEGIDPMDWEPGVTADTIVNRTVRYVEQQGASIILLHDAGGETRRETVKALPRIIDYFKTRKYKFTTIADLMGKTKEDIMPSLPPTKDSWLINFNFFLAEATYWGSQILFSLFLVGIALSVGRMVVVAILAYLQKRRERLLNKAELHKETPTPLVSIIVPAYNEEVNAVRTVQSLLRQDYPSLEILFVDDGSADTTFEKVSAAFEKNAAVKVYTKPNGGKASALNYGINLSTAEFVVCIDADTQLKNDAVSQLMKKFFTEPVYRGKMETELVGAVAGNVKVANEVNMITRWQSIEYITAQNFDRRAFDLLNCITVVPGAIGAFRKAAIVQAGMFSTDTLAEDCDLTVRLLRNGYIIRNCTDAISYTEAPESLRGFMKQRFRWSFGVMQTFWKHNDACFNPKYKALGMVALPNILVFQILLPFLAPLADLVLVISLIAAGLHILPADLVSILVYYGIFMLVDIAGAAIAFLFEQEPYKKLIWMIPQRLVYRQLMYYILVKSFIKAVKGELQGWGKLKRTGNVNETISLT